jgi:choice-of-anchor A domain-containing protein
MTIQKVPATARVVFLAAFLCAGNALANSVLYAATPYNVFMLSDFTSSGSDTQGGIAAGGNLTISAYSVASNLTSSQANSEFPSGDTLVSGGLLTASNGTLVAGNAYGYTTNVTPYSFNLSGGTLTNGSSSGIQVVDFSQAATQLKSLSTTLAASPVTAVDSCTGLNTNTITCTASANNLNTIDISASDAAKFAGKSINIVSTGTNVTLLINMAGTSDSLGGAGFTVFNNGVTVLFNYYQATQLTLASGITASVLAPLAAVSGSNGNFDGTLIGNSFTGNMEFHDSDLFSGNLSSVTPEPVSMALAGAGLAGLSLLLRKRNSKAS